MGCHGKAAGGSERAAKPSWRRRCQLRRQDRGGELWRACRCCAAFVRSFVPVFGLPTPSTAPARPPRRARQPPRPCCNGPSARGPPTPHRRGHTPEARPQRGHGLSGSSGTRPTPAGMVTLQGLRPLDYSVLGAAGEGHARPAPWPPASAAASRHRRRLHPLLSPPQQCPLPCPAGLATLVSLAAALYTVPWRRAARGAPKATRGFNVLWRGRVALALLSAAWAVRQRPPGQWGAARRASHSHAPLTGCAAPRCRPAAVAAAARQQPLGRQLARLRARRDGLDGRRMDVQVGCARVRRSGPHAAGPPGPLHCTACPPPPPWAPRPRRIYLTLGLGVLQPLCAFLTLLMLTAGLRWATLACPAAAPPPGRLVGSAGRQHAPTPLQQAHHPGVSARCMRPPPPLCSLPCSRRHRPDSLRHPNARLLGLAALCTLPVAALQVGGAGVAHAPGR